MSSLTEAALAEEEPQFKYAENKTGFWLTTFAISFALTGVVFSLYNLLAVKNNSAFFIAAWSVLLIGCILQIIYGFASFYPRFYRQENLSFMLLYMTVPICFGIAVVLFFAGNEAQHRSRLDHQLFTFPMILSFILPYYSFIAEKKSIFRPIHRIRHLS